MWGNTSGCASFSKKLHSHCSSLPNFIVYLAVLALTGEGEAGPTWKPTSLVDATIAIEGKINIIM